MSDPRVDPDAKTVEISRLDPETLDGLQARVSEGKTELLGGGAPSLLSVLEAATGELELDPRFTDREALGRGGMGKVLRVEDVDLRRDVAKKVLQEPAHFNRFIEEAQITSQLEHPGVLPVHDFGVDRDGNLFFTMQLIRSRVTLADLIRKLRAGDPEAQAHYTFERRVQLIQQVCHALHYAHDRGVIHRDIKPSNIMVGEHGEVFLVDWGIAKLVTGARSPAVRAPAADASEQDGLLGTPAYMAPEQLLGDPALIDRTSDTFALTAVLFELLTLTHYLGDGRGSAAELVARVAAGKTLEAESLRDPVHGRVPRILSRICRKGLSKRKEQRYATAAELEQVLQRWLEGNAPIVCPGTAIQRILGRYSDWIDAHPTLVPWATIVVLLVLLAGIVRLALLAVR